MRLQSIVKILSIGAIALVMAGCGGGSSSGDLGSQPPADSGSQPPAPKTIKIIDYMYQGATSSFTVNDIKQKWNPNGKAVGAAIGSRKVTTSIEVGLFLLTDTVVEDNIGGRGFRKRFPATVIPGKEYTSKDTSYLKMTVHVEGDTLIIVVVAYDFEEVISHSEYHFSNRNGLHKII